MLKAFYRNKTVDLSPLHYTEDDGITISRFPLPLNPPTLAEVNALIAQGNK